MVLRRYDTVIALQELGLGGPQRLEGDYTISYV
jgi:hypothetical protein